ncbi:MAG: DUF3043 domain-containing protein [Mycobacterium sp.]|nr:MAG: DUF3043 domain-containing protein [Mycobacterium sp.]
MGRKKNDGVVQGDVRGDDPGDIRGAGAGGTREDVATSSTVRPRRTTAPKGRPTPKRGDRRRGPVAPAPMTAAEARARRKTMAGPKLSREERRAQSAARRAAMAERRERMMAGEEAYLLPRDQGPVRRYVRDVVDSRRNVLGLFLPAALALMFVMFGVPQLAPYVSPAMTVLMLLMVLDGIVLGRKVTRLVDEKFPNNTESRWKLGFYAASRASQMRRMRAPRPQVQRGSRVH